MRRLALLLALVLLVPAFAGAQSIGGGFIQYYPPAGSGTAWDGGAFSAAAEGPTGCAAPAYSFTADTNAGLCLGAANDFTIQTAASGNSRSYVRGTASVLSNYFVDSGGNVTGWDLGDEAVLSVNSTQLIRFGDTLGSGFLVGKGGVTAAVVRSITAGTGVSVSNGDGQSGNPSVGVDTATTPQFSSGTGSPPGTCTVGQLYFDTDDLDLYSCTATNTWTRHPRFSSGTATPSGTACDAATEVGSLYYRTDNPATNPTQFYLCAKTGASSYAWARASHSVGTTAPAKCDTGDVFFDSDATAGSNWFGCTAADTWTALGGGGAFDGNVTGQFSLQADTSPASIGANQNDYTGCSAASNGVCRLTSSSLYTISGIAGGSDGRQLQIHNIGANTIVFSDEDTNSSAANRFNFPGAGGARNHYLLPREVLTLTYDATDSRWRAADFPTVLAQGTLVGPNSSVACSVGLCVAQYDAQLSVIDLNTTTTSSKMVFGDYTGTGGSLRAEHWSSSASGTGVWGYSATGASQISSHADSGVFALGTNGADPLIVVANGETRHYIEDSPKTLTETTATSFVQIALASGEMTGGRITYTVEASDGTDHQALSGELSFAAVNKAGTETCATPADIGTALLAQSTASTLTCTWTCSTSPTNAVDVQANCTSGLTQSILRINYQVTLNGAAGVVTPQ